MDRAVRTGLTLQRRKSLAEQISDTLVEEVGLGMIEPNERIVEAEIASRFNVSRVPVREALKILVTQGILEGEPHRGLRLVKIDDKMIDAICEARLAIESIALRSLLNSPENLHQLAFALDARISEMSSNVRANDLIGVNHTDVGFHADICLISGNHIIWTLWQSIARHVWIVFGQEILSETSISNIVDQHSILKDVILAGKYKVAHRTLEEHIMRLRKRQRP